MKLQMQILLQLIEILIFTSLITWLSSFIEEPSSKWVWVERIILCYGIYQFPTYLWTSNKVDSQKDMYLALLRCYKDVHIFIDTGDKRIKDKVIANVDMQLKDDVFNDDKIRSEYRILLNLLDSKDKNEALYKINLIEHQIESVSLEWRFSIFLSIVKERNRFNNELTH